MGRTWTILNSAMVSVIVAGLVGAWFSAYRECRKEAEERGIRYLRSGYEIDNRHTEYALAMALAADTADLKRRLAEVSYTYLEFKDRTVRDIQGEMLRLRRYVDDEEYRSASLRGSREIPIRPNQDFGLLGSLWNGQVPQLLTDDDMPKVHDLAERMHRLARANIGVLLGFTYKTNCSAPVLFRSIFGDEEAKTTLIKGVGPITVK